MKAIVLTYDKYRPITEHMIGTYSKLWPDHPFHFVIPYQDLRGTGNGRRDYIQCDAGIKSSVLTLLEGREEEEWIYWCIDDKYPIWLDVGMVEVIMKWISKPSADDVSGVSFCRCRGLLKGENLLTEGIVDEQMFSYLRRRNYEQIWLHQFLRVKVLRYLFARLPNYIVNAKEMDSLKKTIELPPSHKLYVSESNYGVFGESVSRGKVTQNCYDSMLEIGVQPPHVLPLGERRIIIGTRPDLPLENNIERLDENSEVSCAKNEGQSREK